VVSRIGNSIFFIGLILLTLAAIVGLPAAVPIGILAACLICLGAWMWSRKPKATARRLPLSQQRPENKILAGIPAIFLFGLAAFVQTGRSLTFGLGLILLAYAAVGLIEKVLGGRLAGAKSKWEDLSGWMQFLISVIVIVSALFFFVAMMPWVAKLIYG
jgi:hypothetical protein